MERMVKRIIEALLFVSENPLTLEDMQRALDGMDFEEIKKAIEELREDYLKSERSFGIAEVAGGYQIVTNPEFAPWIGKLFRKEDARLSAPALETLAIIAYKQPLTRGEVEKIRGVNVEGVLKTLLDKNLIRVRGRKDAPGRPIAYGTTDEFLKRFGLKGLEQLPKLRDFSEHDLDFDMEKGKVKIEIEKYDEPNTGGAAATETVREESKDASGPDGAEQPKGVDEDALKKDQA